MACGARSGRPRVDDDDDGGGGDDDDDDGDGGGGCCCGGGGGGDDDDDSDDDDDDDDVQRRRRRCTDRLRCLRGWISTARVRFSRPSCGATRILLLSQDHRCHRGAARCLCARG